MNTEHTNIPFLRSMIEFILSVGTLPVGFKMLDKIIHVIKHSLVIVCKNIIKKNVLKTFL